jgi:hypothetical protein
MINYLNMAKLIRSAIECAYKIGTVCLNMGELDKVPEFLTCNPKGEENFPRHCPLEDGIKKNIECFDILCPYVEDTKVVDRRKCKYFLNKEDRRNYCDYLTTKCECIGINCGHFESKHLLKNNVHEGTIPLSKQWQQENNE